MSTAVEAWSFPPVDDIGYISSAKLLELSDDDLADLVVNFEHTRYKGWRNWNGNWRRVLKMDSTHDMTVLDWGCGVGIEALQYARAWNVVSVTDIVPDNVALARRVIELMGYAVALRKTHSPSVRYDIVHCAGALHHVPNPVDVMREFAHLLYPGGEVRLMLYSDWAWRLHTGMEPPEDTPSHPMFQHYVSKMDGVGDYADWYDDAKLERLFGEWFRLENFEYLTQDMAYCGAVMVKR